MNLSISDFQRFRMFGDANYRHTCCVCKQLSNGFVRIKIRTNNAPRCDASFFTAACAAGCRAGSDAGFPAFAAAASLLAAPAPTRENMLAGSVRFQSLPLRTEGTHAESVTLDPDANVSRQSSDCDRVLSS